MPAKVRVEAARHGFAVGADQGGSQTGVAPRHAPVVCSSLASFKPCPPVCAQKKQKVKRIRRVDVSARKRVKDRGSTPLVTILTMLSFADDLQQKDICPPAPTTTAQ